MDQAARRTAMRVGGLTAIVGSLCALTGAALWASSGTVLAAYVAWLGVVLRVGPTLLALAGRGT